MNILLTGGTGYIGSHTAVELIEKSHTVEILDNLVNSKITALDHIEQITGVKPKFHQIDLLDFTKLNQLFAKNHYNLVIHFAGLKAVGESVAQPLRYYRNNLDTTLTLCEVMQAHGVKRIVFSSSATVYGNQPTVPYREDMPSAGCTNPYGWTKYMIEKILEGQAAADPEWSVVLLRYFNPIGAHASGLIGEDPSGIPNNLMPFIAKVAVGELEKLSVFGNDYPTPDGTGIRDYIHVVDLAKGHVKACDYAAGHSGSEIINLGTGRGCSVLELVNTFIRVNGVPVPYVIAPRRPGDIAENYADPSKAKRLLGWEAEKTIEDMCRDTYRFQQKNPKGYRT